MLTVGLTGGIGAGKSTVSNWLVEHGAELIDSDVLARDVVAVGTPGLAEVVAAFGTRVLDAEGALDRAALAGRVFGDDAARARLEAIVHPRVRQEAVDRMAAAPDDAIVVNDVPLLVEVGLAPTFDLVMVVEAPETTRLERLERRGLPPEKARARIAAQAPTSVRRAAAGVVIDNTGDAERTRGLVAAVWRDRLLPFERDKRLGRPAASRWRLTTRPRDFEGRFQRTRDRLRYVLGELAGEVEHVGPTAVAGLPAPDEIDLQLTVPADERPAVARALTAAGFPPDEQRGCHSSADPGDPRFVWLTDEAGARAAVLLRDHLRRSPSARKEYLAATSGREDEIGYRAAAAEWRDSHWDEIRAASAAG